MTPAPYTADVAARLKELLAKATPGEWEAGQSTAGSVWLYARRGDDIQRIAYIEITPREQIDAELIAAALNALPSLLSELEALGVEIEGLREGVRDLIFALETTDTCLRSWNGNRGGPANVEGILEHGRALISTPKDPT